MDAFWVVLIMLGLLALYVLPSLYAAVRQTSMLAVILVLNLLLGWTVVGWFAALALAVLLPSAKAPSAPDETRLVTGHATVSAVALDPAPAVKEPADFFIDPSRVAALSLIGPMVYELWWLWRFFEFARRERFPRSRSFWWVLAPFYGYVVIGRLFSDLEAKLGPSRPAGFNAATALALLVAANASGGVGLRMGSLPFLLGGLVLSCIFTAMAFYQAQSAVNAYIRMTDARVREAGWFPGEALAVLLSLALFGLLVLGSGAGPAAPAGQSLLAQPTPTASATVEPTAGPSSGPIPTNDAVLRMTSEVGDYIGQGRVVTMTPPTSRFFGIERNGPDLLDVTVETAAPGSTGGFVRWTVELAGPRGQALSPGTYLNAQRAAFRTGSAPGLDVFGDGRGCNNVFGSFVIKTLAVDSQGHLQRLEATFVQHCETASAPALNGYIRIVVSDQTQTAARVAPLSSSPLG